MIPIKTLLGGCVVVAAPVWAATAPLQVYPDARIDTETAFDGDSFRIHTSGTSMVVRLYFADCAETRADHEAQVRRVGEQTRYFGLENVIDTLQGGLDAKTFAHAQLQKPFTVHTRFARAGGMSRTPRVYGFITTHDGQDLARLLVAAGLARTRGLGCETPTGISRSEMFAQLEDLEAAAMLARRGIWKKSDAELIATMRARQREEESTWKLFHDAARWGGSRPTTVDANRATRKELELIKGIGPSRAEAIIIHRPYQTLSDLERIPGIGKTTLASLDPPLTVSLP